MRSLTTSWTTVVQHITALLTNFALISDLGAGRAPVGFTRSNNKLSHIYRKDLSQNVVRKQLSLQMQTYASQNCRSGF